MMLEKWKKVFFIQFNLIDRSINRTIKVNLALFLARLSFCLFSPAKYDSILFCVWFANDRLFFLKRCTFWPGVPRIGFDALVSVRAHFRFLIYQTEQRLLINEFAHFDRMANDHNIVCTYHNVYAMHTPSAQCLYTHYLNFWVRERERERERCKSLCVLACDLRAYECIFAGRNLGSHSLFRSFSQSRNVNLSLFCSLGRMCSPPFFQQKKYTLYCFPTINLFFIHLFIYFCCFFSLITVVAVAAVDGGGFIWFYL